MPLQCLSPWGRGQATKHGGRELLELCPALGSSDITRVDWGDTSLPDGPGWSLEDSGTRVCCERTLASLRRRRCTVAARAGPVSWAARRCCRGKRSGRCGWGRAPEPRRPGFPPLAGDRGLGRRGSPPMQDNGVDTGTGGEPGWCPRALWGASGARAASCPASDCGSGEGKDALSITKTLC
ncbi:hypothetical protein NDU88_007195 [Pleurodeles waltl]|uniref:Uncharacterized protein n=1 Tax=Pleurodeles waltl TaxID=8319 RepID=A0AAV7QN06_PLEWA|nr:hypothetical protein NDU88_007195 [Pleurodeles waltl]